MDIGIVVNLMGPVTLKVPLAKERQSVYHAHWNNPQGVFCNSMPGHYTTINLDDYVLVLDEAVEKLVAGEIIKLSMPLQAQNGRPEAINVNYVKLCDHCKEYNPLVQLNQQQ